jgi:uncharacterized protein YaeQ
MTLKSTIYIADCQIADIDRGYYQKQIQHKPEHFMNLTVISLPKPATDQLAQLVKRVMQLQFSLQNGQIWVSDDQHTAHIKPEIWLALH